MIQISEKIPAEFQLCSGKNEEKCEGFFKLATWRPVKVISPK